MKDDKTYRATYGHNENDHPGTMTFEAENDDGAITYAKRFAAAGYRSTWINVGLMDGRTCHARGDGQTLID